MGCIQGLSAVMEADAISCNMIYHQPYTEDFIRTIVLSINHYCSKLYINYIPNKDSKSTVQLNSWSASVCSIYRIAYNNIRKQAGLVFEIYVQLALWIRLIRTTQCEFYGQENIKLMEHCWLHRKSISPCQHQHSMQIYNVTQLSS